MTDMTRTLKMIADCDDEVHFERQVKRELLRLVSMIERLEAQLYAVGAGGIGAPVQPEPNSNESAYQRGYLDGMAKGRRDGVLEQPQGEQPLRYLDGGSRYKVAHLKTSGYCIIGLPEELLGRWVALVDATDNKHMDSHQQPSAAKQPQDHVPDAGNTVPTGWKLVPVEPNMTMTQTALNASRRWAECDAPLPRGQELWAAGVCWKVMVAAAPQYKGEAK